jgi:lauroyl/myristoyl acyltransferase
LEQIPLFLAQARFNLKNPPKIATQVAIKQNRGAVVVTAHMANWEFALLFGGCHFGGHLTAVARHIRFGWLEVSCFHMNLAYRLRKG